MNSLRLYKIDINYIKYLYSFDNRVQYNPNREDEYSAKRPYLGVVLKIDKYDSSFFEELDIAVGNDGRHFGIFLFCKNFFFGTG